MEIYLRKGRAGIIEEYGLIYGGLVILILLSTEFLSLFHITFLCPFKAITGLPCPTCGGIRSLIHLAHLDPVSALVMNPLISFLVILGIIFFIYSITTLFLRPLRIGIKLDQKGKMTLRLSAIGIIALNWLYLIFHGV